MAAWRRGGVAASGYWAARLHPAISEERFAIRARSRCGARARRAPPVTQSGGRRKEHTGVTLRVITIIISAPPSAPHHRGRPREAAGGRGRPRDAAESRRVQRQRGRPNHITQLGELCACAHGATCGARHRRRETHCDTHRDTHRDTRSTSAPRTGHGKTPAAPRKKPAAAPGQKPAAPGKKRIADDGRIHQPTMARRISRAGDGQTHQPRWPDASAERRRRHQQSVVVLGAARPPPAATTARSRRSYGRSGCGLGTRSI